MASGTGLLDLTTNDWDAELLDALGLDAASCLAGASPTCRVWIDGGVLEPRRRLHRQRSGRRSWSAPPARCASSTRRSGRSRSPGLFLYRMDERRVIEGGALSDGGNLHAWLEKTLRRRRLGTARARTSTASPSCPSSAASGRPAGMPTRRARSSASPSTRRPRDIRQAALEGVGFRFAAIADLLPEVEEVVATGGALSRTATGCRSWPTRSRGRSRVSGVEEASLRGAAVAVLERAGRGR